MITFSLYRQIRKFGQLLRGGAGQREIFLGAFLGVMVGMIPGFNLTLLLAILILLLLNANTGFAALGTLIGTIGCYLLAPISYQIGYVLIHDIGLENFFRWCANTPVLALMDLDRYALIGGLPLALLLGLATAYVFFQFMGKLRKLLIKASDKQAYKILTSNPLAKVMLWFTFGKQKVTSQEALEKESGILRKSGLILALLCLLVFAGLQYLCLDMIARYSVTSGLSMSTGAEVNLDKCDISITSGRMSLHGLEVTDPAKPTHNLVAVGELLSDISIQDLLTRNYTIDVMKGKGVRFDTPRQNTGKVYRQPEDETPDEPSAPGTRLEDYIQEAEKWLEYAKKFEAYLEYFEAAPETEEERRQREQEERELAITLGYLKANARLASQRPLLVIHKIELEDFLITSDYPPQHVTISDITSHPVLHQKPMTFQLRGVGTEGSTTSNSALANITLNLHEANRNHQINLAMPSIPMHTFFKTTESFPFQIEQGQLNLKLAGEFSSQDISLPFKLSTNQLNLKVNEGHRILGMDASTASKALQGIKTLEVDGALAGRFASPRVKIEINELTQSLKKTLIDSGKQHLMNRANQELEKVTGKLTDQLNKEVGKTLENSFGTSKEELKDVFSPLKKKIFKEDKSADETEQEESGNDKNKETDLKDKAEDKAKSLFKKLF